MEGSSKKTETGVIRLTGIEPFIEHTIELLKPARRSVDILTTDMDKPWLGNNNVVEQIKQTLLKNRYAEVRLLVADPTLAIRSGHPLIGLIRRLSRFEAKVIDTEILDKQPIKSGYLLIDQGGIIMKQSLTDFTGFVHFDDKQTVKSQKESFEQYWRYSHSHSDLRDIHI